MKICLVSSHGGHFTETLQLLNAFEKHEIFFVTYHSAREGDVRRLGRAYFSQDIGMSISRMLRAFPWAFGILGRERPDVVLSLGAEIAVPFFTLSKVMGIKTIFIESWCRVENLSLTGRLLYPLADQFWVQWSQLAEVSGAKVQYHGAVI